MQAATGDPSKAPLSGDRGSELLSFELGEGMSRGSKLTVRSMGLGTVQLDLAQRPTTPVVYSLCHSDFQIVTTLPIRDYVAVVEYYYPKFTLKVVAPE